MSLNNKNPKKLDMEAKTINLRECYCNGVKPTIAYEYEFYINEELHKIRNQIITGTELHELAGTNSETHFIRMKTDKGKILVGPTIKVDLTECGIERFIIQPYKQEIIDLNDCFCQGVNPVITFKYLIKINNEKYEVEQEEITGREIILIAGKDPEKYSVRMFSKEGKLIVKPDQSIDLTKCGVERFVLVPLDCTEGFTNTSFKQLLTEDIALLSSIEKVDYITENNLNWLILRSYPIPKGYNVEKADIAILIPLNYPAGRLDMAYFHPPLQRIDEKPIVALTPRIIEGKTYQQWSRHRTKYNKWNPDVDNVESHLDLMMNCLLAEFKKR